MVGPPTIFLSSYLLQGQAHGEDLKGPQPPLSSNSALWLSQQVQGGWLSMDCLQSADTNLLTDGGPGQWWRSLGGLPKLPFASTGDWQALPATREPKPQLSHILKYNHGDGNNVHGILPCTPST